MSRVGINPVAIASGVEVKVLDNNIVEVKGPKGTLTQSLPDSINVEVKPEEVVFAPANPDDKNASAFWGLSRALVNNMVEGVTKGFSKKLEINGVGYKAQASGRTVKLNLGYSHDINYEVPEGIEVKTPKGTEIEVSGIDKQKVGQVAAEIRKFRKPEPYKGKGIKFDDEVIIRKEGKKK